MKTCLLVFSGYNSRAIISFLRVLEKKKIPYFIIAKNENDEILKTIYKKNVILVRESLELKIDLFNEYVDYAFKQGDFNKLVIAPTTEGLIRFLLPYKDTLEEQNIILPVVNKELYELISDKYSFGTICKENGIRIPEEIFSLNEVEFPVVAKPRSYKNGILKPVILKDKGDTKILDNQEHYYFQEYIGGRSIYLLYYFDSLGNISKFSQENLLQQPYGKSIIAAKGSYFHETDISSKFESLFLKLKFRGLVMIEVKLFENDFYMIEANPRMWGPSQLFLNAGKNLFEDFLIDYNILSIESNSSDKELKNDAKYFWLDGLFDVLENDEVPTSYNKGFSKVMMNFDEWKNADVYNGVDILFKGE